MWNKLVFIFIALFIIEACGTSSHSVLEKRKYRKGWFIHNKGSVSNTSTPKKTQRFKSYKENSHPQLISSTSKPKRTNSSPNKREEDQNNSANNNHESTTVAKTKSSRRNQKKSEELAVHKSMTNHPLVKNKDLDKTSSKKEEGPVLSLNGSLGYLSLLSLVVFIPFLFRGRDPTDGDEKEQPAEYVHSGWVRFLGIFWLTLLGIVFMILLLILLVGILWDGVIVLLTIGVLLLAYLVIMTYVLFLYKLNRKVGDNQRVFSKRGYKKFAVIFGGVVVLLSIILTIAFFSGQL